MLLKFGNALPMLFAKELNAKRRYCEPSLNMELKRQNTIRTKQSCSEIATQMRHKHHHLQQHAFSQFRLK